MNYLSDIISYHKRFHNQLVRARFLIIQKSKTPFIFSHKTKDTGILNVKIDNDGNFKYYFDPCLEKDEYTKLLDNEDKQRILKDLESYSLNVKILEDGQIIPS